MEKDRSLVKRPARPPSENTPDPSDRIAAHFDYLTNEYGFSIRKKEFVPWAMGNAYVIFQSSNLGIEVSIDRNQVLMAAGDPADRRQDWFEFSDILDYFSYSSEKPYVFPEGHDEASWDEAVDVQLERLAHLLRSYCEPMLRGDLSIKEELAAIARRQREEWLQKWGMDPTPPGGAQD